jgi:uncharacterized protein (TIGR04255 family)
LGLASRTFTTEELEEVFARPPLREVAFEVRFQPRLRVQAEIWRLQEQLATRYPEVGKESALQTNGTIFDVAVFSSSSECRVIKVTHQNFLIAFTRYSRFEDFREEVVTRTEQFCTTFGIDSLTRVGLRYVNEIILPTPEPSSLLTYVRPLVTFDRFPVEQVDQLAVEIHSRYRSHLLTVRTALLPGVLRTYVLDIDCHNNTEVSVRNYAAMLGDFHDSAQRLFLDHITEDYKDLMREKQ